ncbi:MAG: hypothetical protein WD335_03185 [Candidatus Paceibacterota bacterium]
MNISKDELVRLLQKAQGAHHEYEKTLDKPDDDWASWYANYIEDHVATDEGSCC